MAVGSGTAATLRSSSTVSSAATSPHGSLSRATGRQQNVKLEAFKQKIESSKIKRAQDFQERRSKSKALSEQLNRMPLSEDQKEAARRSFNSQQDEYMRESRKQVTIQDFACLAVIGTGAFGVVRLCQKRDSGKVYAMKQMVKHDVVHKNHVQHIRAEKDALSMANDDWVIGLHYTFQDDTFLYMVMDYLPGGDLMTYLMRKETFSEEETRFYIAELVEAVDYIHTRLEYIHRDIKPDNVVFDREGHIHLLDFGLCKQSASMPAGARDGAGSDPPDTGRKSCGVHKHPMRAQLQSVVGTPDYMGPEVYRNDPYGKECDWWSVGIIMFEMLFGGPPFSSDKHDPEVTSMRVLRWRQYFDMPPDESVGEDARSLIRGLICDPQDRLTADAIRHHPFFQGFDFSKLRTMAPPIKPVVNGPLDTSNFDNFAGVDARYRVTQTGHQVAKDPSLFAFHDYGYRRDLEAKKPSVTAALHTAAASPIHRKPAARVKPPSQPKKRNNYPALQRFIVSVCSLDIVSPKLVHVVQS